MFLKKVPLLTDISHDFHIQIDKDNIIMTSLRIDHDNKLHTDSKTANKQFDMKEYIKLIQPIEAEKLDDNNSYDDEHKQLGTFLFEYLFPQSLSDFFHESYNNLKREERRLRIRLFVNDAKISNVAWEFLYDKQLQRYLCTFPRTPLTRFPYDAKELANLLEREKLRTSNKQTQISTQLLFVAANAYGDANIKTTDEIEKIKDGLNNLSSQARIKIQYKSTQKGTWTEVFRELNEGVRLYNGYNILHFYGHGNFDGEEATLTFETDGGNPDLIRPDRFSALLDLPLSQNLGLVFLNACNGAKASEELPNSGLAHTLFLKGMSNVSSVVAMQFTITINAAEYVAQNLYFELAKGAQIDDAIQSTRAMLCNNDPFKGKRFFATPVIFMNTKTGYLFGLPDFTKGIGNTSKENKMTEISQPSSRPLEVEVEPKVSILSKVYHVIDNMIQVIHHAETLRGKSSTEILPIVNLISSPIQNFTSSYTALVKSLNKTFQNLDEVINRETKFVSKKIKELSLPFSKNKNIEDVGAFLRNKLDEIVTLFEDFWKFICKIILYDSIGVAIS